MKKLLLLALLLSPFALPVSAQTAAITKTISGDAITEDLTVGIGRTLTLNGALAGTPSGGALDLSALTLTLPVNYLTAAQVAAAYQPLDADLTSISALATTSFGRSLLTQADAAAARTTLGAGTSSFDGTWASLTAKPANVVSFGGLANAAGWLRNNGSGTLSYATPAKSDVGLGNVPNVDATNADNITTGTLADARIASTIARDSEVSSAVSALSSVYQPLDSDLTAWAGVNPSNYSTTAAINGWFADPSTNGSFSASAWRTDLGLVIGTNVQAYDADLADLADGSLTGSKVGTGINADNITTGTVADARIASSIARDSEVTSAISALSSVYQPLSYILVAESDFSPASSGAFETVDSLTLPAGTYMALVGVGAASYNDDSFVCLSAATPLVSVHSSYIYSQNGVGESNGSDVLNLSGSPSTPITTNTYSFNCVLRNPVTQTVSLRYYRVLADSLAAGSGVVLIRMY